MERTHDCPICGQAVVHWDRYRKQVCGECADRTADELGRWVRFTNLDLAGGLIGAYNDDGEPFEGPYCWIDGVKCIADEHRFGGIVIQVV